MWMARLTILDPTAPAPAADADPGPAVGSLRGARVGVRSDRTWRSFESVADEWEQRLRDEGATVHRWVSGNRVGDDGEKTRAELVAFVDRNEVIVSGLGN